MKDVIDVRSLKLPVVLNVYGGTGLVGSAAFLGTTELVTSELGKGFCLGGFSSGLFGALVMLGASKYLRVLEQRRAAVALRESEERFRDFAAIAADWFYELGPDLRFTYVSDRYPAITGQPLSEVLGRTHEELFAGNGETPELGALAERQTFQEIEQEWTRPDGKRRVLRISGRPHFGTRGEFLGYRGVGRDVTDAHVLAEQLAFHASHDPLTGLVNRRDFERRLRRVLESAGADHSTHALCYLDLDHFKVVNDTSGHLAGDELLRQLSGLLQTNVRKRDTLARIGGDELAILMEHCTPRQAMRVARSVLQTVQTLSFPWDERVHRIGVSIGLVPISGSGRTVSEVLSAADGACYSAKSAGGNRIVVYREGDTALAARHGEMQWVARINKALDEDRFQLWCQPIVPLAQRPATPRHYEILLRMVDENGKVLAPHDFLAAAERYGLANRLDRWVIARALQWLSKHTASQPDGVGLLCINLSSASLRDKGLARFVKREAAANHAPANKLCFELAETEAITNLLAATRLISELQDLGCRTALDNFGSGLSSFAYLRNLPVDWVKIDGGFVKRIGSSTVDYTVVRSINEIGQAMGRRTVAAWVEDDVTLEQLRSHERPVDFVQGNGIERPRPLDELVIDK